MPQPLSVAQMAGVDAPLVMRRRSGRPLSEGVQGAYTLDGYRRYMALRDAALADAGKERWVLGENEGPHDAAARAALATDMDRCYFGRYIAAWDAVIGDVALLPLPNSEAGAALVKLLAGADSPLRRFLQVAAKETTLSGVNDAPTQGAEASVGMFATLTRKVRAMFGNGNVAGKAPANAAASAPPAAGAPTLVDSHFEALHRLVVSAGDGGPTPLDEVQQRLKEAAVFLDAVNAAHARGLPAPTGDALDQLKQAALGQPAPLAGMLKGLSDNGVSLTLGAERARLNDLWRANVAPFCHAAFDGRYPFDARSAVDVTLDDFTRLIGPGGLIDTFFQTNLLQYVDTTANPWTWRANASSLRMSPEVLQQFRRAAAIRDAFFPDGKKAMAVRFAIVPHSMDAALTRFVLRLNGQTLDYAHDPRRATSFEWPHGDGARTARIDYEPAGADGRSGGLQADGPWALFRLFDKGTLQAKQADRFDLTFDLNGRDVALELDANSVVNPFALPALRQFQCPVQL